MRKRNGSAGVAERKLTYEDYAALDDDKRCELIDGVLYMMSPSPSGPHQTVTLKLCIAATNHVSRHRLGRTFIAPFDVVLSKHDTVQPGVIFVSNERLPIITELNIQGAPDWVAEVLSPTSGDRDYHAKKRLYEKHGVREYWIVDSAAGAVDVFHLERGKYRLAGRFLEKGRVPSKVIRGFSVALKALFER